MRLLAAAGLLLVASAVEAGQPASREAFAFAVELVKGSDADMRAVALERLRDGLAGEAYSAELAERVLPSLKPEVQVLLLSTLAGRGDAAALPGIVKLAEAADATVAAAAIRAIAALGGGGQVPLLAGRLAAEPAVRDAARAALVAIQGDDVPPSLIAAAGDASLPAATRVAVLEILAERRDRGAVPVMLAAAVSDDPAVRSAAMRSLAPLAGPGEIAGMVAGFLAAGAGRERDEAERAIQSVCLKGPEADRAAAALLASYRDAAPATREALLPLLARVGGGEVLGIVDGLVADPDPAQRRRGLVALSRWPDASVKDRLLGMLGKTDVPDERRLIVGTLIRIAPLPNNGLSDAEKLGLVSETLKLCEGDDERRRLLERAAAVRSVETLRFLVPHLDEPVVAEAAAKGVVELAHHQKLRDGNKAEFAAALDRVLAVAKDPVTRDRAERYKQGKTWERR